MQLVSELKESGHDAIPHLAARQIATRTQLIEIVARCDDMGVREIFVIAGDAATDGPYREAIDLAREYRELSSAVTAMGFAAYPDGHANIAHDSLTSALVRKQEFLRSTGLSGYLSTQMCFEAEVISRWLHSIRNDGIDLPIQLGVPGHVDRIKLARISTRLGVGSALKFLRKNKSSVAKLMTSAHFEPTGLIDDVMRGSPETIDGLHVFSFNNIAPTVAWFDRYTSPRAGW